MKPALVCGPSAWTPPRLLEGVSVLLDLGKNFPRLMSGLGGGLSFCVGVPLRPSSLWSRAWILFQRRSPSPPTYPPARVQTDAHARAHTASPTKATGTPHSFRKPPPQRGRLGWGRQQVFSSQFDLIIPITLGNSWGSSRFPPLPAGEGPLIF